jgi:hypothetical protein
LEEVAARHKLQEEVELTIDLDGVVKLDDIRMLEGTHDVDLAADASAASLGRGAFLQNLWTS